MSFSLNALRATSVLNDTHLLIYDNDHDGELSAGDRIFDSAMGQDVTLDAANARISRQLVRIVEASSVRLEMPFEDTPWARLRGGTDACGNRYMERYLTAGYTAGRNALLALAGNPPPEFNLSAASFNEAIDRYNGRIELERAALSRDPGRTCVDPDGQIDPALMHTVPHFYLSSGTP